MPMGAMGMPHQGLHPLPMGTLGTIRGEVDTASSLPFFFSFFLFPFPFPCSSFHLVFFPFAPSPFPFPFFS